MNSKEILELTEVFRKIDTDNTGLVTVEELR
jgi:Ca2+-binding EF-hand superfamily protein